MRKIIQFFSLIPQLHSPSLISRSLSRYGCFNLGIEKRPSNVKETPRTAGYEQPRTAGIICGAGEQPGAESIVQDILNQPQV